MDAGESRDRRLLGALMGGLFLLGIGLFVLPFAFPTAPPIVRGFQATRLFSPNDDQLRDTARVSFRMNEPGTVTVAITDPADRGGAVRRVLFEGPRTAAVVSLNWDGKDGNGTLVPDGRYVVSLRARAGRKQWNNSRAVEVDATLPTLGIVTAQSAVLAGPGDGQCRIAATSLDRGTVALDAAPAPGTAAAVARFEKAGVSSGETVLWNWDGNATDGTPAPPGLYVIRATLTDRARNVATKTVTCWVGQGTGRVLPASPKLGDTVRVQLRDALGRPMAGTTPITLEIARRTGTPGGSTLNVVGARVGGVDRGPIRDVKLVLPRKIAPRTLWLIATTPTQRILIPLRP